MNKIETNLILLIAIALILISPVLSQNVGMTYDISRHSSEMMIVDFGDRDPIPCQNLCYKLDDGWCNCRPQKIDSCPDIDASLVVSKADKGQALQLQYDLGDTPYCWVQIICEFNPERDLSAYDHMRINWTGDNASNNSLQVVLRSVVDPNPKNESKNLFYTPLYYHTTQKDWPGLLIIPFTYFKNESGGGPDLKNVERILISVVNYRNESDSKPDDTGKTGNITIESISVLNIGSRDILSDFEKVEANETASKAAAQWLASQQQPTGLLKSWENTSDASLYNQGLALIVFSQEMMWDNADKIVESLVRLQNEDGSWYQTYNSSDMRNISDNKWTGDIAWAVYALNRYHELGGTDPNATVAMENGADWIEGQINSSSGCLLSEHVEGTISAWWALTAAGGDHGAGAKKLKMCLMDYYWDEEMGRFMFGKDNMKPVLDVQTWGASFLIAINETDLARRALSYAREVFTVSSRDGEVMGLSATSGTGSLWNEGTGQYIVAGGEGSNGFLQDLISQQRPDGAMPGSKENFSGDDFVWDTTMHGVVPTAWLYFASSDGPFNNSIAS